MQCKHCQAELEKNSTVCPNCGKDNAGAAAPKKKADVQEILKIVMASVVGLVLLVLLAGVVHYGVTGSFLPKPNDVYAKNSYSVGDDELDTSFGNWSFQRKMDKVIATMGEHTLTNRMLQVYYWDQVNGSQYADLDSTKPLDEQIQDPETGMTWQQFFIEEAVSAWQQDTLLMMKAEEAGFQLPEQYAAQFETLETDMTQAALNYGYTSLNAMLQSQLGAGCDFATYREYMLRFYMGGLYWTEHMEAVEVSDAEIEAYFQANEAILKTGYTSPVTKDSGNLVDVRHILIMPEGGTKDDSNNTVYTEEEWEAARVKAQEIYDEWLAGDKSEDSFAQAAMKHSDDGSASSGGLYTYVYKGQMVKEFEEWCFDESRQTGDHGLVKTEYGYHIMYYVFGEPGWIRVCRDGAKAEKAMDELTALQEQNPIEVNYRSIVLAEVDVLS